MNVLLSLVCWICLSALTFGTENKAKILPKDFINIAQMAPDDVKVRLFRATFPVLNQYTDYEDWDQNGLKTVIPGLKKAFGMWCM